MEEFSTFGEHFFIKSVLKRTLSPLLIISLIRGECVESVSTPTNALQSYMSKRVMLSIKLLKKSLQLTLFRCQMKNFKHHAATKRICIAPHPIIEPPTTSTTSPPVVVSSGMPDV